MFLLQTKHASFCKYFFFFCCLFQAVNSANLKNLFGRQSCIHDRFHAQMFFVFFYFFCKKNEEKKKKTKSIACTSCNKTPHCKEYLMLKHLDTPQATTLQFSFDLNKFC